MDVKDYADRYRIGVYEVPHYHRDNGGRRLGLMTIETDGDEGENVLRLEKKGKK
jgi:hypothetical protein